MQQVKLTAVPNIPLIQAGDNLGSTVVKAVREAGIVLKDQDILVLASKIVSKAEGRTVEVSTVVPSDRAKTLARASGKDPEWVELILRESRAVLDVKPGIIVTVHRLGFVCTSAGVDGANVGQGTASLLPLDPDKSARDIQATVKAALGTEIGVIINDSGGIEYREGSIGLAVGVAGVPAILRGESAEVDLYKRQRNVNISFADEVAAAASLLMGQSSAGLPLVVVSGLAYPSTKESKLSDLVVLEQVEAATAARQQATE